MHQRSLLQLQGVSAQRGPLIRNTTQDRGSLHSMLRRGSRRMCLHPPRSAPLCAWLLLGALVVPGAWSFLSEEQEELLVELHNHYRGLVSPSASVMLPLKWDPNLKLISEGYAAKCIWNHNPELEDVGENLFAGTGPLDLREALEKWFLEHLDYDFHNNSCDEDKMCGHYTQMVWADTHRVGCAFHLCNSMEGLDWERVSFLVCNYYPAGNYEGERPYVEGDWCSSCPENIQKCENNLCAADTEEEEEKENEEEDDVTVIPPPATSDPSLHHVVEEEEEVVPPSATTELYVQPVTTTSAPRVTTRVVRGPRPAATPAPGTQPPRINPTTWKRKEKNEEKETIEEWKRGETKVDVTVKIIGNTPSTGSVSSPSIPLAFLTGLLTLRL